MLGLYKTAWLDGPITSNKVALVATPCWRRTPMTTEQELKAHRVSAHFKHKEYELGETFAVVVICYDAKDAETLAREHWTEKCPEWTLQSHLWIWSFPICEGAFIPGVRTEDLRDTGGGDWHREIAPDVFTPNAFRVTQLLGQYIDARIQGELDDEEIRRSRVELLLQELPVRYQAELVHEIDLWEEINRHKKDGSETK